MSYNPDALVFDSQVVIADSTNAGITSGGLVVQGGVSSRDTFVTGHVSVNNVKITPNLNDIVHELQAVLANNQVEFADIPDFYFTNETTRSFKAQVSVSVSNGPKNAIWELNGVYKTSGWEMTSSFTGDLTGVAFRVLDDTLNSQVKLQFTNSNSSGETIIRFRATTTAPAGTGPTNSTGIINNTSGSYIANAMMYANTNRTIGFAEGITFDSNVLKVSGNNIIKAENTSSFVNFSQGGSLSVMGDASVAKKIIVGEKIGIANTAPVYSIDVVGDINLTGNLRKNGTIMSAGGAASLWESNANEIYYTSGNVGIGLTNPSYDLDVSGTARADDLIAVNSVSAPVVTASTGITAGTLTMSSTTGTFLFNSPAIWNTYKEPTVFTTSFSLANYGLTSEIDRMMGYNAFAGNPFLRATRDDPNDSLFANNPDYFDYLQNTTGNTITLDIRLTSSNYRKSSQAVPMRLVLLDQSKNYIEDILNYTIPAHSSSDFMQQMMFPEFVNVDTGYNTIVIPNNYIVANHSDSGNIGATIELKEILDVKPQIPVVTYSNKNVGIGTTSPSGYERVVSKPILDIAGQLNVRGDYLGRHLNYGILHNADKSGTFSIGRWDGEDGGSNGFLNEIFCGLELTLGQFNENNINHSAIAFKTWGNSIATSREVMRINHRANVGIGTTAPNYRLDVQGGEINASGTIRSNGSALSSDRRVKENIVDANTADNLKHILDLKVRRYDYTQEFLDHTNRQDESNYGFIAQEVQEVIPNAVDVISNTLYKNIEIEHPKLDKYGNPMLDEQNNPILVKTTERRPIREISDFHFLKKELIFTEAIGAIQELSKKLNNTENALSQALIQIDQAQVDKQELISLKAFLQSKFPGEI